MRVLGNLAKFVALRKPCHKLRPQLLQAAIQDFRILRSGRPKERRCISARLKVEVCFIICVRTWVKLAVPLMSCVACANQPLLFLFHTGQASTLCFCSLYYSLWSSKVCLGGGCSTSRAPCIHRGPYMADYLASQHLHVLRLRHWKKESG